jgi:hypothetical protein
MTLPRNPGTYTAHAKSKAISQKPGKCPQLVIEFQLEQFYNGAEWEALEGDFSITHWLTLINKDGTSNDINIQSIVDAYSMPYFDFKTLEMADFSATPVQIVLEEDEYEGKTRLRVKYLNNISYERQSVASDPAVVQSLDQKYGALLRKKFKAKAANGATNGKQTASQVLGPAKPKTADEAKGVAWSQFKAKTAEMTTEQRKASFIESVAGYSNNKAVADLTLNDWDIITNQIAEFGPYKKPEEVAETVPANADDLPF